jgi:hypothetical protein
MLVALPETSALSLPPLSPSSICNFGLTTGKRSPVRGNLAETNWSCFLLEFDFMALFNNA